MRRRTVTIDEILYREIQKVRASLIESDIVDDISFTTAINMVLLGGFLAIDRLIDTDWALIRQFLEDRALDLELDSFTDRRADVYLANLRRPDEEAE